MTEDDIAKLRAYISKKHKYDFKSPIKAFVYEKEIVKVKKTSDSGGKHTDLVEKKVKVPCEIFRAIISFVPSDNPPKLLYMVEFKGDIVIKSEEEITFNN